MAKKNEPQLTEDNVYPNDGTPFQLTEPEEQKHEREAEKGKVLEGLPIMRDVIKRFKVQIKLLESINGIPREWRKNPNEFMNAVNANDISVRYLKSEVEWLEGLIDDYFKQK